MKYAVPLALVALCLAVLCAAAPPPFVGGYILMGVSRDGEVNFFVFAPLKRFLFSALCVNAPIHARRAKSS